MARPARAAPAAARAAGHAAIPPGIIPAPRRRRLAILQRRPPRRPSRPQRSRFFEIARRIAASLEPAIAQPFLDAVVELQARIDAGAVAAAIANADDPILRIAAIEEAARTAELGAILAADDRLAERLLRSATATGEAGADVLKGVLGVDARFNARDPVVIQFAREQAAGLIVAVDEAQREAVRIIVAAGADFGLTPLQQASAIRQVVGLRPDHTRAVLNFTQHLRAARSGDSELVARAISEIERRRLDAATQASLKAKLRRGTLTEADIAAAEARYAQSLLNYRAQSIARTESLAAAHHGTHQGWKQAIADGALPGDARRIWIVTLDDRLAHWMVPGMNPDGRGMDELFETPEGAVLNPPSRTHCRCGVGLLFPSNGGVL